MRKVVLAIVALVSFGVSDGIAATPAVTNGAVVIATTKKSCPMKVSKAVTDAGVAMFARDRGITPKSAAQILDKAATQLTARLRKEGKLKQFCATSEGLIKSKMSGAQ